MSAAAAFFSDTSSTGSGDLRLLPQPRRLVMRGAPWRPAPASFLHIPASGGANIRRRAQRLAEYFGGLGWRTRLSTTPNLGRNQAFFTANAAPPKLEEEDRGSLRGPVARPEGYRLKVTPDGVLLHGSDDAGFFYAGRTLCALLEESDEIPGLEIEDYPLTANRALHLDCRGWAPTSDYLKSLISLLASYKFNILILEYGAHFAYRSQPELADEEALTAETVKELSEYAKDHCLTLVPFLPTLGDVGHILRLEPYAAYRENPLYYQQFCPSNPATFDVVTAMLEELIAAHPGAWVHLGGEEIRFLGWCGKCRERVRQLGGRAALFLEYVGRLCRYATMRGRKLLFWDDAFHAMNDAQLKWLPEDVVLLVRQYEGAGGRALPELLVRLDRFRRLERTIWGAGLLENGRAYESFDNVDGWSEAAELGYLTGAVVSIRTCEHPQGATTAPAETLWPNLLYAAERLWTGRKPTSRHEFADRFIARFHGPKKKAQRERLWGVYDLLRRGLPLDAREYLRASLEGDAGPRNRETLLFLDAWAALTGFISYAQRFDRAAADNYARLQAGDADPFYAGRLRWRVLDLKAKLPPVLSLFREQGARLASSKAVEEFLAASIAYHLHRLDEIERLLEPYPLPDKDWRRRVRL